jgi:hypothetical protein
LINDHVKDNNDTKNYDDIQAEYDKWLCPFCGEMATLRTEQQTVCDSRTCSCGAICLAAPVIDTDEIVDEAIGLFAAQIRDESKGYNPRLLDDLSQAGVEMRQGKQVKIREGNWGLYISLWFRRTK